MVSKSRLFGEMSLFGGHLQAKTLIELSGSK